MSQTRSGQHDIFEPPEARTAVQRMHQPVIVPASGIGRSAPLGAVIGAGGVNFSLYSREASGIELLLFDREDDGRPGCVIPLDPSINHTYHYWHAFVPGLQAAQLYGYRVHGPFDPSKGLRFDATKVLIDPVWSWSRCS
jgi:isoamylase